ncbi:MAG: methionine--tRNA ligase [Actinomycetota bacterium]
MGQTFYVTTPIYYVNDVPHIGHAYTTVATDFVARYHRLRGDDVFFLTGTDEHGQKVAKAAEEHGKDPQAWCDEIVPRWREVWGTLDISNDDFIRTTEKRHTEPVQRFVQALQDAGEIYLGKYEGPYCVACETFYQESELVDGKCPIHGTPVDTVEEENYFFRLSAYQDRLLEHYESHPEFVQPQERRNEVLSFVKGGLQDLSMSRTSFTWGVPIPWDPRHVMYVWIDALQNYITAVGYGADEERFVRLWPADYHFVGKDILRHHAVIWPAMLMAAGVPLPKAVFAHGWLLVGGEKMSKTKLTGIHPNDLLEQFGVDAYRYYFLREVQFGQDGNFSWESMVARYNADLANDLGNLAARVQAMLDQSFGGEVPEAPGAAGPEEVLETRAKETAAAYDERVLAMDLSGALGAVWDYVGSANRYLVEVAPWKLAKEPDRREDLARSLYAATEALRIITVLISPVMPRAAERLWSDLGIPEPLDAQRLPAAARWGGLQPGTKVSRGESLFPRIES